MTADHHDDDSTRDRNPAQSLGLPSQSGDLAEFAGFRILRRIAGGGMGVVFAAFDPRSGRDVAIKVIRPESLARPNIRERFDREARALAQLDHPNVVPLYQAGEENGVPFLVMPLLIGETLDSRLRRSPLSVPELIRLAGGVALGLEAAHQKGLIHRDLKPSNLWLDGPTGEWERARVFDFGLVSGSAGDTLTIPNQYLGTPEFTSPEQARLQDATPASDLFSLGAVLYRAATGQNPFPKGGPHETLHAVATAPTRPPSAFRKDLPAGWSNLIIQLLAKDPEARPPSATALLREIDRLKTSGSRVGWLIGSFAVVGLLVILLIVLFNAGGRGTPVTTAVTIVTPDTTPLTARVDVQMFNKNKPRGVDRISVGQAGALPCEKGEYVRYVARANRPAYLYLMEFDEEGKVSLRYPWDENHVRPSVETKQTEAFAPPDDPTLAPSDGKLYKMLGDTNGLVTIIVLARATPLELSDADITKWFADVPPVQNPLKLDVVAWYDNGVLVRDDPTRGGSEKVDVVSQPAMALQNVIARRIKPHADFVAAVQFGKRGVR
jgi:hypothetical protein